MTADKYTICDCALTDAAALTQLALRAKAHWGYERDFMQAASAELTVTVAKLSKPDRVYKKLLSAGQSLLGFYCIAPIAAPRAMLEQLVHDPDSRANHLSAEQLQAFAQQSLVELDALFIEPDHLKRGAGRQLFAHALTVLAQLPAQFMLIHSDPFAEGFYLRQGCQPIAQLESGSVAGRYLPLLVYPPLS